MPKIALAMIVKGSDDEAELLHQCLNYTAPNVDGIFITRTHKPGEKPNKRVKEVAEFFGAEVSEWEWNNSFADARNFNFSQVPEQYDYILWCDADDAFRGIENLHKAIQNNGFVDAFSMMYLYEFDEYNQPIVAHVKTQVVKNDGCVEWVGDLHEDFKANRQIETYFIKNIERLHLSSQERFKENAKRNKEVAEAGLERDPDDPRSYWNLGNALFGVAKYKKAIKAFQKFLEVSMSDDEKYLARIMMADAEFNVGGHQQAIDHLQHAIGLKPEYPDAYNHLGSLYFKLEDFRKAKDFLMMGMVKPKPYYQIIAFNPRAYDYAPLMMLAKCYILLNMPHLAQDALEACLKIYPNHKEVKDLLAKIKDKAETAQKVADEVEKLQKIKDDDVLKRKLDALPMEFKSHPMVCLLRNTRFEKKESSGKDLVYYCGYTENVWNPDVLEQKGLGGSEEAVINLSKQWADLGWNVTVYANCGHEVKEYDGVTYKPFWMWNYRDKQDVTIIWRSARPLDFGINSEKIYVDVHDVMPEGEFNKKRLQNVDKIFVKTHFHRSLFPKVPDEKFEIIPNGMDFGLFKQKVKKDQYLMVNTSSPDRSLDVLPKLFKKVKEQVPEARCQWAYGWDIWDIVHKDDEKMMKTKRNIIKEMKEAGIEMFGRVTQKDACKMYLEANVLAYPTEFAEIDCITVKKAQACGAIPIATDFGALEESIQHGVKIHSTKTKDNWCLPYQATFGLEDEKAQQQWVEAVVKQLKKPIGSRKEMKDWTEKFRWERIAGLWNEVMK